MRPLALLALALGAACDPVPDLDLERMKDQPSLRPYEATHLFPNGRAMQAPVEGTVAREAPPADAPETTGLDAEGRPLARMPIALSRAMLIRGRSRYDIFCAACHGLRGDGHTTIRQNFDLRRPPSLLDERVRARPPGDVYRIVSGGWGLMPSYGQELTVEDRWAVVAYLRALQRSQSGTRLGELPAPLRAEAEAALAAHPQPPPLAPSPSPSPSPEEVR
jgi:mono/diheme cytochrome c family protein